MSMGYDRSYLSVEKDFVEDDEWYIELVRNLDYNPALLMYEINSHKVTFGTRLKVYDQEIVPLEEDEFTRHVRLAHYCADYGSVRSLVLLPSNLDSQGLVF